MTFYVCKIKKILNDGTEYCVKYRNLESIVVKSSRQRCSVKKGVLRNFAKFTGKHVCQSLFFNKVAGADCNFIKKILWHRCFPVYFAKFLRAPFSQNTVRRLLLCGNTWNMILLQSQISKHPLKILLWGCCGCFMLKWYQIKLFRG